MPFNKVNFMACAVPAGFARAGKCVSQTDCVRFLYQDGKFDILPVVQ